MDGKEKSVWSRRDFLKDLGLVSLLFAAGCSPPAQSASAPPAIPLIDRWAPLRFETATFALG